MEKSTVCYYVNKIGLIFNSDKEKNDFIKYCDYMMFSNYSEPYPVPEEDVKDNFRYLYKYIEMVYEEDVLEAYYGKQLEEKEQKENDEMKYYEDYFNSDDYYEDLYSQYYFGIIKK